MVLRSKHNPIIIIKFVYMRHKKYRITVEDFIKANRKASREEEIAAHGKQISMRSILQKSKKAYDRRKGKKVSMED